VTRKYPGVASYPFTFQCINNRIENFRFHWWRNILSTWIYVVSPFCEPRRRHQVIRAVQRQGNTLSSSQLLMILALFELHLPAAWHNSRKERLDWSVLLIRHVNNLIESSKQATSESSSLHSEHCAESEGKVVHPKGSSDFTATASLYKKCQSVSGTSNRLAPACSGLSCPCRHIIEAVGPASASLGASIFFRLTHCCSLKSWKKSELQDTFQKRTNPSRLSRVQKRWWRNAVVVDNKSTS